MPCSSAKAPTPSADGPNLHAPARQQLIGTFCALLELIKIGVARAWQAGPKHDIAIVLRDDLEGDVDDVVRSSGLDDEELPAPPAPNSEPQ